MIRDGNQIRLTAGAERHTYTALTGCLPSMPDPRTLPELQDRLEQAAHFWEHSKAHYPDGVNLARLAREFVANCE